MSFLTGFAEGFFGGIDKTLQKSIARTRDYNDEVNKIRFERQMDEKDEWDDDVEEAKKAIENGASVFTMPDGSLDPRGATYAAAALKRSGSLADYNTFIAKLKEAKANNDINPIDYFDQLPEDFEIGSAKDYAQAFVGPMADYSKIEPYSMATPAMNLLGKILGRPIDSRKKANQKLQLKLKAAGFDQMSINSDIPLPTIKFYDYKFNINTIKKPQNRLATIGEMLADPNVQTDKEKVEYLREQQNLTLQTIKDFGPRLQKVEANDRLIELLIAENSRITDEDKIEENNNFIAQYHNENDDISLEIELEEAGKAANLRENPLGVIQVQEKILVKQITQLKTSPDLDNPEKAPSINSEISDLTAQLNELLENKKNMALDASQTFAGKKKIIQDLIESRTINDAAYRDSEQYQIDRAALIDYDNKIAISNIDANNIAASELSKFEGDADEAVQIAISQSIFSGATQKVTTPNGGFYYQWNAGKEVVLPNGKKVTQAEFEAFKIQTKKDWYDGQMDMFRIGKQPALFAAAGHFYQKMGFGPIPEEKQKSFFSISEQKINQYDDSLRPNPLLETTTEAMEYTVPEEGTAPKPPLPKPTQMMIKYQGVDGVKKLLKDITTKDPNATKSQFIQDYTKLYPGDIPEDILAEINSFYDDLALRSSIQAKSQAFQTSQSTSKDSDKKDDGGKIGDSAMGAIANFFKGDTKMQIVGRYKNDFTLGKSDSAKKTAIKQAKKELMDKHNMSASEALNFIKGEWNPTGKGDNAKYFYSGGLMSKQSM